MQELALGSREKILAAARKLFADKGFENTSVDQLAEEAQVAKGTIYVHFSGKSEILLAVIKNSLEQVRQTVIKLMNIDKPFLECFPIAVNELLNLYENNSDLFRLISAEKEKLLQGCLDASKEFHPLMMEEYINTNTILANFMEKGIKEGVLRNVDPSEAAMVFQAIISTFVFKWIMGNFTIPISKKAETICQYYMYGMANAGGGAS